MAIMEMMAMHSIIVAKAGSMVPRLVLVSPFSPRMAGGSMNLQFKTLHGTQSILKHTHVTVSCALAVQYSCHTSCDIEVPLFGL